MKHKREGNKMRRLKGLLDYIKGLRAGKGPGISGVFVVALMLCMLTPSYSCAEYVFERAWPEGGISAGGYTGRFSYPTGVAVDNSGNVYVVDTGNNRIQKFDSRGVYLTYWGSPGAGDGQFDSPRGVAVDNSGNVYVADTYNHRIQKFDSSGTYLTQWGISWTGLNNSGPLGVAVNSSGNVYVADTYNHRIQKFDSSGGYLGQWGSLGTGEGQFSYPRGVAVDNSGNVYVADSNKNRIQKFDSNGTYLTKWGSFGAGNGQFDRPEGVAVDSSGNVYVVDSDNHRIQKFDSSGGYLGQWGSLGTGLMRYGPQGVAADSSGNVYVADTYNHRIQKFDSSGGYLTQWGGDGPGAGDGQFDMPHGVALDNSGDVYVTDSYNHRIQKFDSSGTYLTKWGSLGAGDGQFNAPFGVAVDSLDNVYVTDTSNHRVQKFDSNGTYLMKWGSLGAGDGQFEAPTGVAVDSLDNVYVVDTGNNRIQKFNSSGGYLTKWGTLGSGTGQFRKPLGVAVNSSDNVYVADSENLRIQMFSLGGNFILQWGTLGAGNGQFQHPDGVAVDSSDNVYVVDAPHNGRIQKFDSSHTYLAQWGTSGGGYGQLGDPYGVAVDSSGNVYVADSENYRIQKFRYNEPPTLGTLTPSVVTSGANATKGFSAVYSDANGYADLRVAYLRVGPFTKGICVRYDRSLNKLYLRNDANTADVGSCKPGITGTLTNNQGTLNCGFTTKAVSGNNLTVNWKITPKSTFTGTKNIYMYASDNADATAGWADKGDWTITANASPALGPLTPSLLTSNANVAKSFKAVYSDANGYADLNVAYLRVGPFANGIYVRYHRPLNIIHLRNDANTDYVGSCTPGVAGTLTNTQGTLLCGTTTTAVSGNTLTVNWDIMPKSAFAGTKDIYMYASDKAGATVGWTDRGDWTIANASPTLGTLTPSALASGANVAKNFKAIYSDANGYADLTLAYFKMDSGISGVNAIWAYYKKSDGKVYLYNDARDGTVGSCTPGTAGTLTNTQGALNCAATTVTGSGHNLTVNWNIKPNPVFVGTKNIYMYTIDSANASVGWTDKGDWTITANTPPTLGTLTPSTVTSAANVTRNFSAVYSDADGYSDLAYAYLLVNTEASPINSIFAYYEKKSGKIFLGDDAGIGLAGSCKPGAPGHLTNSQGTLDCASTTVSRSGNDLTINWSITPKAAFTGVMNLYMNVSDSLYNSVGWTDKGDWTITP